MSYALDEDARQGLEEDDLLDDAEVDTLVREAIAQALGETHFKHDMVSQWTNGIIEGCLKRLSVLAKPFKYVVTCSLSQKVQRWPRSKAS
jgi:dynein light chain Tctex-type 1